LTPLPTPTPYFALDSADVVRDVILSGAPELVQGAKSKDLLFSDAGSATSAGALGPGGRSASG